MSWRTASRALIPSRSGIASRGVESTCGAAKRSVLTGAMLGLLHALAAGLVLASAPAWHPAMPHAVEPPGFLMIGRGQIASVLFVLAHVGFGVLMSFAAISRRVALTHRLRA